MISAHRQGSPIRQLHTHARLLRDVSTIPAPPGRSRRGRPDAIIVPASRPASGLVKLVELAAALETQLVVLCSRQTRVEQVRRRMERVPGARGLVAYVDDTCILGKAGFATSSAHFTTANGGRDSDLSLKRNVGLLLARLLGWSKIIFVDDDVTVPRTDLARLAGQLERYQFAGMTCPCFPDNSVVCHAHRLAKLPQDIFVSGGTLGVNCGSSAPSFFPDIYNEDWFFFGGAAARGELAKVGEVRQTPFDPYENPMRARHEEFGDLLAEGLYALIESVGEQDFDQILDLATARYWTSFINVRRGDIAHTEVHLQEFRRRDNCSDTVEAAINSLQTADASYQSNEITADLCVDFLAALRRDQETWRGIYRAAKTTDTMRDAMSWLNVTHWTPVRQAVLAPV